MSKFIGIFLAVLFVGGFRAGVASAADLQASELVAGLCSGCHEEVAPGHLFRINDVRKTPEGWDMTLFRMQHVHGVEMSPLERAGILAYLADMQGLAPSETAGYRYVLEERQNAMDKAPDPELNVMCGRCHTNARYALQRRDKEEWLRHMNFHVGQYPSLEYQASSRDRYWWQIATTELPQKLGALYPLKTAAWDKWKNAKHASLAGSWRIIGWQPGHGLYQGVATFKAGGDGRYAVSYAMTDPVGKSLTGAGKSIVYTGFEWRGSVKLGDQELREVYAASEDGRQLTGRWYDAAHLETGADVTAVRIEKGKTRILAASPPYIKAGGVTDVTLIGFGLTGSPDFGPDVTAKVISSDGNSMKLSLTTAPRVKVGARDIKVAGAVAKSAFMVYDRVDSLRVTPEYAVARVGGGHAPAVPAQFEAVGYMNGPDGKPGTMDDIRIGVMKAAWQAKPFDEEAARMQDVRYAGVLSADGLFVPAGAGPNPARKYSTNNAGNLSIVATVNDGGRNVTGAGHMIVTVQRWNLPPIR